MQLKYNKKGVANSYSYIITIQLLVFLIVQLTSCKKDVTVDPPVTSVTGVSAYSADATASAVLTGIYANLSASNFPGGITSMSFYPGLSSDELTLYSGANNVTYTGYYKNALTNINTGASDFWINLYRTLFTANSAIEGLSNAVALTPAIKDQLMGEAKFIRAFINFYLVNLYGDVPLVTRTDYTVNATLARSPRRQIWNQIVEDLNDAQGLLTTGYVDGSIIKPTTERVRPNKWAATALLARTYLYLKDFTNAEALSTAVINNKPMYSLGNNLNSIFLKNSTEAIWQLQPVIVGYNTPEARVFIIPSTGPSGSNPVYLSSGLLNSFETGDKRKTDWVNSVTIGTTTYYYPFKYKSNVIPVTTPVTPFSEYAMVLRLAEQYLIRAEARAQQGNIDGAISDLNAIRSRAQLPPSTATTKAALLEEIQHERQVELFTEWGHRWFDIKRTDMVDAVMSVVTPQKGGVWNINMQWYPIPLYELQQDPNLVQNLGY